MAQARRVLIVLPQWAHLMDVAGPAQAFSSAAETGGRYIVDFVADGGSVLTHQGVMLGSSSCWPDLNSEDLVLVPGWKTERTRRPLSPEMLGRIRKHWDAGGRVASVCAGSLLLAEAGVLEGQTATTHHDLVRELELCRGVRVERDVLYTCSGRLHTSAGIASGIDLALHIIGHDHGPRLRAKVARTLVVPAARPGGQSQVSILLAHRDHVDDLVHRAQDLLDDPAGPALSLGELAGRLGTGARTLSRHFQAATGLTPHAYGAAVRRERAAELIDAGWSRESAARAVGYADARSLRRRSEGG